MASRVGSESNILQATPSVEPHLNEMETPNANEAVNTLFQKELPNIIPTMDDKDEPNLNNIPPLEESPSSIQTTSQMEDNLASKTHDASRKTNRHVTFIEKVNKLDSLSDYDPFPIPSFLGTSKEAPGLLQGGASSEQHFSIDNIDKRYDSLTSFPKSTRSNQNFSTIVELRTKLHYFTTMPTKLYFDTKKAEAELSAVISEYPQEMQEVLKIVIEVRDKLSEKHLHRLQDVLTRCLIEPSSKFMGNNARFIKSYFIKYVGETDLFAKHVVAKLIEKQKKHEEITVILATYTLTDMVKETLETLFRGTNLSSSLCKHYGNFLWQQVLKELEKIILKELNSQSDISQLNIDPTSILMELMERKDISFNECSTKDQNDLFAETEKKRVDNFMRFAALAMAHIYALKFPEKFSQILQNRRSHIIKFLEKNMHQSKEFEAVDRSRIYISELLFLRILNPHLIAIAKAKAIPKEKSQIVEHVMVQLTKCIQCLAKQAPFGSEKDELLYEKLNPLYEDCIKTHQAFLDLHTFPRNENHKKKG